MLDYPELVTARLRLRLLRLDDAPAVYRHFADPQVTRFMDIEPCADVADAEEIIRYHIDDPGCRWGLFDRSSALVGTCGYHCLRSSPDARAELGYDLGKAYWGQGLMWEALEPVIAVGFAAMRLDTIDAGVHPDNARSLRLLRRLGFRQISMTPDGLVYCVLGETEWASRTPGKHRSA